MKHHIINISFSLFALLVVCIQPKIPGKAMSRDIPEDSLVIVNKSHPLINSGGCGYFAYYLYQRVNKKRYSIVSIDNYAHVCLRDKKTGYFLDSNGFHDLFQIQIMYPNNIPHAIDVISEAHLRHLLNNFSMWNPKFNKADTAEIKAYIKNL